MSRLCRAGGVSRTSLRQHRERETHSSYKVGLALNLCGAGSIFILNDGVVRLFRKGKHLDTSETSMRLLFRWGLCFKRRGAVMEGVRPPHNKIDPQGK